MTMRYSNMMLTHLTARWYKERGVFVKQGLVYKQGIEIGIKERLLWIIKISLLPVGGWVSVSGVGWSWHRILMNSPWRRWREERERYLKSGRRGWGRLYDSQWLRSLIYFQYSPWNCLPDAYQRSKTANKVSTDSISNIGASLLLWRGIAWPLFPGDGNVNY